MSNLKPTGPLGVTQRPPLSPKLHGAPVAASLPLPTWGWGPAGGSLGSTKLPDAHMSPRGASLASPRVSEVSADTGGGSAAGAPPNTATTGAQGMMTPRDNVRPPLANAVAVLSQRLPSRGGPREAPASIGKFLPEFQFTEKPSFFRRLLVFLIVACVSPSLLDEDPFPPLRLIFSKQAMCEKS